ncbi:hypothetical protein KAR48_06260, partial [bacterium]|nr:hypothetical protein [bacterium]
MTTRSDDSLEMIDIKGLLGMFPNKTSFLRFKNEDPQLADQSIPAILEYAYKYNFIDNIREEAFLRFLDNKESPERYSPLSNLDFDELIETVRPPLSTNQLVNKLATIAEQFNMPKVQASMLTRLKQDFNINTNRKRAVLRTLAYWIASKRPQYEWNYEKFFDLHTSAVSNINGTMKNEGVVLLIDIQSRGGIVESREVKWMRDELACCINDLNLFSKLTRKGIRDESATSISIRLPAEKGMISETKLYSKAISHALTVAHQMSVRWLLSEHSTSQKTAVIYMHAGLFSEANIIFHTLTRTRLDSDPKIILTDFAYLCSRFAEIKAVFQRRRLSEAEANPLVRNVWSLEYFWSYTYYEFIPQLLDKDMLPAGREAYMRFKAQLFAPEQSGETQFKALNLITRKNQETLLLLEIAKVLLFRNMFNESDHILSQILLIHPDNVIARTMRLGIYLNMGLRSKGSEASEMCFNRAQAEGVYLTTQCEPNEEIWCEIGLIYYNRAVHYLRIMRKTYLNDNTQQHPVYNKGNIIDHLVKAEEAFFKGLAISTRGKDGRCLFHSTYSRCIRKSLMLNDDLLKKGKKYAFEDTQNIYKKTALEYFAMFGMVDIRVADELIPEDPQLIPDMDAQILLNIILMMTTQYDNSISSSSYLPNVIFSYCLFFWDFSPILTIGVLNPTSPHF